MKKLLFLLLPCLLLLSACQEKDESLELGELMPTFKKYLTFVSEGSSTVSLTNNDNTPAVYISWDKKHWTLWDYSELAFTKKRPLYICGDNPDGFSVITIQDGSYTSHTSQFETAGDPFRVSGDIMSLINPETDLREIPSIGCFSDLFYKCRNLVGAPELPATILKEQCYYAMFARTGLKQAPELPATQLAKSCYMYMFTGSDLVTPPVLPATTMMPFCYKNMFSGCPNLEEAPVLPATELAEYCYDSMFWTCSELKYSPDLCAQTLVSHCYQSMFCECTSLRVAPAIKAVTTGLESCLRMFQDCTGLEESPDLPAFNLAMNCYTAMFARCYNLVKAPALPAVYLATGCYSYMFEGCSSLVESPVLPAPILKNSCYMQMFNRCFRLKKITCLATDPAAGIGLLNWVTDVSTTGSFIKSPEATEWPVGPNGIPEGWLVEDYVNIK